MLEHLLRITWEGKANVWDFMIFLGFLLRQSHSFLVNILVNTVSRLIHTNN